MAVQFIPWVRASSLVELQQATASNDGIVPGMCAIVDNDRRYWRCTEADDNGSTWLPGRSNAAPPWSGMSLPVCFQDDATYTKTGVTISNQVITEPICTLDYDGAIVEIDVRVVSSRTDILGTSYYRRLRKVFQRTLGFVSIMDTIWDTGAGLLGTATLTVVDNKPTLRCNGVLLMNASWTYTVSVCGDGITC